MNEVTLETERLLLRWFRETDFPQYLAMSSDPEVMKFLSGTPQTESDWLRYVYGNDIIQKEGWSIRIRPLREITGGQGTDIAVEACGHPDAFNQIFQCLHHQGLAVVFGLQHEPGPVPLDWQAMYERLPRMVATSSVRSGNRVNTVVAAADLVSQGRLDLAYQVTHQLPFEQVGQAFEMYSRKLDNSLKVVLAV